jgi:hypothetical protein
VKITVTTDLNNSNINIAKEYHEETKHSEITIRTATHYLDWANKPLQYKVYQDLTPITLPSNFPHPSTGTISELPVN